MAGRSNRRRGGAGDGSERIQALVDQKLSEGLQYEALQLYRGVVSRKSARGNHEMAVNIAEQGMHMLLQEGYADSATELGSVLVGILSDRELAPTEDRIDLIKRINNKYEDAKRAALLTDEDQQTAGAATLAARKSQDASHEKGAEGSDSAGGDGNPAPRGTPSTGILQGRFLKLAVNWTAARGSRLGGHPELCALLGRCLWGEGDHERGRKYLVLGERPKELCDLIVQDVPEGSERELAVAKGVLQFASKSSLRDANRLLEAYEGQSSAKPQRLLAFCGFLLKTCEYDAGQVFQKLLDLYRAEVSADDTLFGLTEKIGILYFNVRLRPPSMLDNIMGMFGGGPKT